MTPRERNIKERDIKVKDDDFEDVEEIEDIDIDDEMDDDEIESTTFDELDSLEDEVFDDEEDDNAIVSELDELTHTIDIDGEKVPSYCFVHDITNTFSLSDDEAIKLAKDNGYVVYKVIPNDADIESGLVIADKECSKDLIVNDYKKFFGVEIDIEDIVNDDEEVEEEPVEDEIDIEEPVEDEVEIKDEVVEESMDLSEGHHTIDYKGYELDINDDCVENGYESGSCNFDVTISKDGKELATIPGGYSAGRKWVDENGESEVEGEIELFINPDDFESEEFSTKGEEELYRKYFKKGWYDEDKYNETLNAMIDDAYSIYQQTKSDEDYRTYYILSYYLDFDSLRNEYESHPEDFDEGFARCKNSLGESSSLYIGVPTTRATTKVKKFNTEKGMNKDKNKQGYNYSYFKVDKDDFKGAKKTTKDDTKALKSLQALGKVVTESKDKKRSK